MRAVTQNAIVAVFASAEIDHSGFVCRVFNGGHAAVLVAAVTEGLLSAFAAGAPVIVLARLYFDREGSFLGNDGVIHGILLDISVFDFYIDRLEAGAAIFACGLECNADSARCGHGLGKFHLK